MPIEFERLRSIGLTAGLTAVGVTTAEPFGEVRVELERRRAEGLHAGMQFTYRNPARSTDPSLTLKSGRRLVVGAYDFHRPNEKPPAGAVAAGRVASYASRDHYSVLRTALEAIARHLRLDGHSCVVLADQNNLVDRAAAHRAGIGWWGKSSNILVHGAGSKVVLGSVLTDAEIALPGDASTVPDACGSCTACMSGCPTGAIIAEGVVDANRCLAWLLQTEGPFPVEYRAALGDRIYGCDDCQDACPPNRIRHRRERKPARRVVAAERSADLSRHGESNRIDAVGRAVDLNGSDGIDEKRVGIDEKSDGIDEKLLTRMPHEPGRVEERADWVDLIAMLDLDDDMLMSRYGRWYVARRDPVYLRRNALVVLGNVARADHPDVRRVLQGALGHHDPIVRSHAVWAARRLGLDRLTESLLDDPDPEVQRELARP